MIQLAYQSEDDLTDKMVLVKAAFWGYESEYRIIGHTRAPWGHSFDEQGRAHFPPELLTGITLQDRTSEGDRADVIALACGEHQRFRCGKPRMIPTRFGCALTIVCDAP